MATLTQEDVLKLARLARIDLTTEEIQAFADEISQILKYIEQLQAVDTSGLEPTIQVTGLQNVMRKDQVRDYGYAPKDLLAGVPTVENDHIKVKRMVG